MPVEQIDVARLDVANDGGARLLHFQNTIDEARHRESENRVHMVPELIQAQDPLRAAIALREAVAEAVEKRIEVVVVNDEQSLAGMAIVVVLQVPRELQYHRRFSW